MKKIKWFPTDGPTDLQTQNYRVACTRLKMSNIGRFFSFVKQSDQNGLTSKAAMRSAKTRLHSHSVLNYTVFCTVLSTQRQNIPLGNSCGWGGNGSGLRRIQWAPVSTPNSESWMGWITLASKATCICCWELVRKTCEFSMLSIKVGM